MQSSKNLRVFYLNFFATLNEVKFENCLEEKYALKKKQPSHAAICKNLETAA